MTKGLDIGGNYGAVEHEAYCMPSEQKRNTEMMNSTSGYHNMADLANTKAWPSPPGKEKRNVQLAPQKGNLY